MSRLYHTAVEGTHRWVNRRVRPTALGLLIFTAALGLSSVLNRSMLQGQFFGQTIAVMCTAAAGFFATGFVLNRASCARVGYLLTFLVLATQTVFVWIEMGSDWWRNMLTLAPKTPSVWMGLGVAVIAGGSYWLEGFREDDG